MKRWATLTIGLLVLGFTALQYADTASGQSGAGWVVLFDGKNLLQPFLAMANNPDRRLSFESGR
jgi:hypothetical protein